MARLYEKLQELDLLKTTFFSSVSHEFRTPLTLMLGPIEDALGDASVELPEAHRSRMDIVHRNALRLLKLVNTLLDFSRIEAGRIEASFEPTDLALATAELASHFRSACEKAGLGYVVDCPPLDPAVYVDRDLWEKIILNLLSNAFKFTLAGEIAIRLRAEPGQVHLTVSDTGTGIPAHELPRLFDRFHRVEGSQGRTSREPASVSRWSGRWSSCTAAPYGRTVPRDRAAVSMSRSHSGAVTCQPIMCGQAQAQRQPRCVRRHSSGKP